MPAPELLPSHTFSSSLELSIDNAQRKYTRDSSISKEIFSYYFNHHDNLGDLAETIKLENTDDVFECTYINGRKDPLF